MTLRAILLVLALLDLLAGRARAQPFITCTTNAECPHGHSCELDSSGDRLCMHALCDSAEDCEAGALCVPPSEPRCGPQERCSQDATRGQCRPPHVAPCKRDADCGPQYRCKEMQSCGCRPTRIPSADGGPAGFGENVCSCLGTGTFRCEIDIIACNADAEGSCPGHTTCQFEHVTREVCYSPKERDGGACEVIEDPRRWRCIPSMVLLTESHRGFRVSEASPGESAGAGGAPSWEPIILRTTPAPPSLPIAAQANRTSAGGSANAFTSDADAPSDRQPAASPRDGRRLKLVLGVIGALAVVALFVARRLRRRPFG